MNMLTTSEIYGIVSLINGLATLIVAIFVLVKARRSLLGLVWALTLLFASGWCLCTGVAYLQIRGEQYLLWVQYNNRFATFIPVFFFHFVILFCGYEDKRKIILANYIAAILILSMSFLLPGQWLPNFKEGKQFLFIPTFPGYPYLIYSLFFVISTSFSYILLIKDLFNSRGIYREQLKFLCIGSFFGFIAGGSTFPNGFGFEIPWGNYCFILMPLTITYAIVSKRLFDIKIAITRLGIFLVVYTFVLGIPFIVLSRTGSGLVATSLAVIFATMGPLIYRFLQMKAEAVILAQQRRYQRILLQAANGMATEHDLVKLSKLIVYILKSTIRLNFVAIFIINKESKQYQLAWIRGKSIIGEPTKSFNAEHSFVSYLKEKREPFLLEETPLQVRNLLEIIFKSRAVIPAFIGDKLLGFVLLGEKINTQPYTDEDINVFKILSRQAALAIENCVFFKESQESQEMMFAAEKLASIGGMADGVAHQIKNRLNQFSLASGELKNEIEDFSAKYPELLQKDLELKKTFDYLTKISRSLIENVKRTDGIIKGILNFAKVENKENLFTQISLKEIADLACSLLMVKHESVQLPIKCDFGADDSIYGIKSQFIEVIYNMLDNAYEATKEMKAQFSNQDQGTFLPSVELSLTSSADCYAIKISDNGIGIKEEDKHKIFAPFFTTKSSYKSGSGIGAYVVKRIIEENHKGKIWFVSTYLKGTVFFIELPKGK